MTTIVEALLQRLQYLDLLKMHFLVSLVALFMDLASKFWNQYLGDHTDSTVRKYVWV